MKSRGRASGVVAALLLGAVSAAATVPYAYMTMSAIHDSTDVLLLRGTTVWSGSERRSACIRWINVETVGPLVNPSEAVGTVPSWAEPSPPPDSVHVRAAAIGIGWPLPILTASWRADRADQGFPPPAERDTSGESPKEAVRRAVGDDPHAIRGILFAQAALDALVLAMPWWGVLQGLAWLRARRRASINGHHRQDHTNDDR